MEIRIATAKVPKFGFSESGDTVEVAERPRGGITCILADGQGHGRAAQRTSTLVAAKALSLISDGARDGAVARAVHDYLFAVRDGKVSADLTLVSVDLRTHTLVISRNANSPILLRETGGTLHVLAEPVEPIGVHERMKPAISEFPLAPGLVLLAMSDGVAEAGRRHSEPLLLSELAALLTAADPAAVTELAESVLSLAMQRDQGRPADDMTVVAVALVQAGDGPPIRRMAVTMPVPARPVR